MFSDEGVLSIPFRLAISVVVFSLAMPMCLSCIESGNIDLSRKAALEISQKVARVIETVSEGGIGEMRIVHIGDQISLLRQDVKIVIGDYPAGPNSALILCSDSKNWKRTVHLNLDRSITGVCSPELSPFVIARTSVSLTVSHQLVNNMNLLIVGVG